MMRSLSIAIILSSLQAFAGFVELSCPTTIKRDGYKLVFHQLKEGCRASITPSRINGALGAYRSYSFTPEGSLYVGNSYGASKSFAFFPKKRDFRVFLEKETGAIKVRTVNGGEFIFDATDGSIDTIRTRDFKVEEGAISSAGAGITVSKPRVLMATFATGARKDPNASILLEKGGLACRLKANRIFRFNKYGEPEAKSNSLKALSQVAGNNCVQVLGGERKFTEDPGPTLASGKIKIGSSKASGETGAGPPTSRALAKIDDILGQGKSANVENTNPEPVPDNKQEAKTKEPGRKSPSMAMAKPKTLKPESRNRNTEQDPECVQRLADYFSDEANRELVDEYIKIQGKITLHRIAWTVMKSSQGDSRNIEAVIKDLLQKRNPELHQQFLQKKLGTRNQALLEAMAALKKESERHNVDGSSFAYTIKYGDVKMMELLVEAEKQHGRSASEGIMDFTSIIKNSLKGRLGKKKANLTHGQKYIDRLLARAKKLENKIQRYLDSRHCKNWSQFQACGRRLEGKLDVGAALSDSKAILDAVYEDMFDKKEELKQNFRWGTYWLHVVK